MLKPNLDCPKIKSTRPVQAGCRAGTTKPGWTRSRVGGAVSERAEECTKGGESRCMKVGTDTAGPAHAKLRGGGGASRCTTSGIKGDEPAHVVPETGELKPGQLEVCGNEANSGCRKSRTKTGKSGQAELLGDNADPKWT